jgi:hypothetical protein
MPMKIPIENQIMSTSYTPGPSKTQERVPSFKTQ